MLLTTAVGGVGLNLTAADRVVIVDPAWAWVVLGFETFLGEEYGKSMARGLLLVDPPDNHQGLESRHRCPGRPPLVSAT